MRVMGPEVTGSADAGRKAGVELPEGPKSNLSLAPHRTK